MNIDVNIVSAFIDSEQGGNPAGVVLNADNLSSEQKLVIAQQVGLSETAFVSQANNADFKLDFFTPTRQIAHCGHATIATFSLLTQKQLIPQANTSKETIDGTRQILVENDHIYMEQLAPRYQDVVTYQDQIQAALGLTDTHIKSSMLVNTGNSFMIIEVDSINTLETIQPQQSLIETLSNELDLVGFYVFAQASYQEKRHATTRMFAPRFSIKEEAATGMAAGPLACYLHDQLNIKQTQFLIEQGYAMPEPSPSLITVNLNLENNQITSLQAGGKAETLSTQTINL